MIVDIIQFVAVVIAFVIILIVSKPLVDEHYN